MDSPLLTGLSPRRSGNLISALRHDGADDARRGQPWSLPLEDWVLVVAANRRTNLTPRQFAPLLKIKKSAAHRVIAHLGPSPTLHPRKRFRKDAVLTVDAALIPTRDHTVAERSKLNCVDAQRLRPLLDDPAAGIVRETATTLLPSVKELPADRLLSAPAPSGPGCGRLKSARSSPA